MRMMLVSHHSRRIDFLCNLTVQNFFIVFLFEHTIRPSIRIRKPPRKKTFGRATEGDTFPRTDVVCAE